LATDISEFKIFSSYDVTAVITVFDAHGLEDFRGPVYHNSDKSVDYRI
jgi:hypothetical protein